MSISQPTWLDPSKSPGVATDTGASVLKTVLVIGCGPSALNCVDWPASAFDHIVVLNKAWHLRDDWNSLICCDEFPKSSKPKKLKDTQAILNSPDYLPMQQRYGGLVYGGAALAFTAGYWALGALRPTTLAFVGCDMVYSEFGSTEYFETNETRRSDVTLQSVESKSARLALVAAQNGCSCVNLSTEDSKLLFPRGTVSSLQHSPKIEAETSFIRAREEALGYSQSVGMDYDPKYLAEIDDLWLAAYNSGNQRGTDPA